MRHPKSTGQKLDKTWQEVERASRHYYYSKQQLGIDRKTKAFVIERCKPFIKGPDTLSLGYVDGDWIDVVLGLGCNVDIVEGAKAHIRHAIKHYGKNPKVSIHHDLFQQFKPAKKFDTIIAGDMIRYLDQPAHFLSRARAWLKPHGHLIVTVPNCKSMHRRIGVLMQLEPSPESKNARDREVGNRRSYGRNGLRRLLIKSGFKMVEIKGCFLKPLSSKQISNWEPALLKAFLDIGDELQDYCWFLYAFCKA